MKVVCVMIFAPMVVVRVLSGESISLPPLNLKLTSFLPLLSVVDIFFYLIQPHTSPGVSTWEALNVHFANVHFCF